jgi:hypothetical protein
MGSLPSALMFYKKGNMVEIRTAQNGTRFMFDYDARAHRVLVFIGERLHMSILCDLVDNDDVGFQKEIDSFMDSWNHANGW